MNTPLRARACVAVKSVATIAATTDVDGTVGCKTQRVSELNSFTFGQLNYVPVGNKSVSLSTLLVLAL